MVQSCLVFFIFFYFCLCFPNFTLAPTGTREYDSLPYSSKRARRNEGMKGERGGDLCNHTLLPSLPPSCVSSRRVEFSISLPPPLLTPFFFLTSPSYCTSKNRPSLVRPPKKKLCVCVSMRVQYLTPDWSSGVLRSQVHQSSNLTGWVGSCLFGLEVCGIFDLSTVVYLSGLEVGCVWV
ncbi:hypothetical protein HOY80DRAFT_962119 [Tuber brumale]|nr:hypothetical protein HOY80DRAFT_962119 [Tuber brumale]